MKSSLGSLASALRSTEVGRIAFHSAGLPGARLGGAGLCEIGFGDAGLVGTGPGWKTLSSEAMVRPRTGLGGLEGAGIRGAALKVARLGSEMLSRDRL